MKAPKGSFYHRFASRDVLLGHLWPKLVLAYQEGFVAAIEWRAGLEAALHMPRWARAYFDDARVLLLHSRHDFVRGDWPAELKRGVRDRPSAFRNVSPGSRAILSAGPAIASCGAPVLFWRKFGEPRSRVISNGMKCRRPSSTS
jgi:AcrR family transcriptional regulator